MSLSVLTACDYNDVDKDGNYFRVKAENVWLTKRIDRHGVKHPANFPKKFKLGKFYNPESLTELLPILETLGNDAKSLVVRHKYINASLNSVVLRQAKFVKNVASKIICMDIDDLELPTHISNTDLVAQGVYVCGILHKCNPDVFPDDMGFIAQGSSSAGLSNTIKLHLWLENYDEVDQSQLRNLFYLINSTYKAKFEVKDNLVDSSLYHDVQAHYTAYPIFEEASSDPLKSQRTVYEYGNRSYVPVTYPSYVKPVQTTLIERNNYLDNIIGSVEKSDELQERIDVIKTWPVDSRGLRLKVIAAYHTAIQEQYSLKKLEEEIVPSIESKRPGESANYINQGMHSAVSNVKACSIRSIPNECLGLKLHPISGGDLEKFLDIKDNLPKDSVTFLKATLGTGKTHNIATWLKEEKIKGKFLAITDTSALVDSNTERFAPAADFRKPKARLDFLTGKVDRLSGTLHSLHKIKDLASSFDFLFIDEADSLLNNLLFASIISEEKKIQIAQVLSELLQNTDRVVISDGDISEETVAQYIRLMEGQRDLYKIDHKRKNLQGVTAYKHTKESSLWGALQGHLELGDKCLLVSDSSPKKLNEYFEAFARVLPDKTVKIIHSASTKDEDIKDIIDNTTTALIEQGVDALLCSPSVTNGVDFNYFDAVFVLTTSENHTPNMRFQAMMRERQPETIHYYFNKMRQFTTGYADISIDAGFTMAARKAYASRREREYKTYIATFNYYLIDSGATVEVIDDHYEDPITTADKQEYHEQRICAILDARDGVMIAKHNDAYEVQCMIKHYYELEEVSVDAADMWITSKPNAKAEYFHSLYPVFGDALLTADIETVRRALTNNSAAFYLATGESLNSWGKNLVSAAKAKEVLRKCGIVHDAETIVKWYIKYCSYEDGVELPEKFKENKEKINEFL